MFNYNNFFNSKLLNGSYFESSLGTDALNLLTEITNDRLDKIDDDDNVIQEYSFGDTVDYYRLDTSVIANIIARLNEHRQIYIKMKNNYDGLKDLLQIESLIIPRKTHYFESVNSITTIITSFLNNIYQEPPSIIDEVATLITDGGTYKNVEYAAMKGIMDIMTDIRTKDEILATFGNPPEEGEEDNRLTNDIYLKTVGLTSEGLYGYISTIIDENDTFSNSHDIFIFLETLMIEMSVVGSDSFIRETNGATKNAATNVFNDRKKESRDMRDSIEKNNNDILKDLVSNSINGTKPAYFAWIRRLGHYLIEEMKIIIGGQTIDRAYGEWIDIWKLYTGKKSKQRGYDILIGDTPELTTWSNVKKCGRKLHIPLPFWFCRNHGSSLPLVALPHTTIELHIKLRDLDKVAYWEPLTYFKRRPRLRASIWADYIYLEETERNNIVGSKIEYLIENIQSSGTVEINKDSLNDENRYARRMYYENPTKSIYWVFQDKSYIDGTQENGQLDYHKFSYVLNDNEVSMFDKIKIYFNGRERETGLSDEYCNFIIPMKHHYRTPSKGMYMYSFSLDPEKYQPSGSANLSRIDDLTMDFQFNNDIADDITTNNKILHFRSYTVSYNILRIMSGMSGLAFFSS